MDLNLNLNLNLDIKPVLRLTDGELEDLIEERQHYAQSDDVEWADLY